MATAIVESEQSTAVLASIESEPFDNEHIVFDAEGADSPATESSLKNKRRRSKRIIGALLCFC